MRIDEYQALAMRTCSIPYNQKFDKLVHGVTGLVSELIELRLAQSDDFEHYKKEFGDCFWMIAEICDATNNDFYDVLHESHFYKKSSRKLSVMNLCSIVQKHYQGHPIDESKVFEQLCYLTHELILEMNQSNIFLYDVLQMNIEKLKKRYPDGFDVEHSLHREKGDI